MARLVPLLALTALAACQDEPGGEGIAVPSGRELSLIEVLTDVAGTEGAVARFRFLAPGLTQDEAETAAVDMQALCDGFALGRVEGMVPAPQQIVISWSAEAVPFGQAAPEVVQFFESYDIGSGACIWEQF